MTAVLAGSVGLCNLFVGFANAELVARVSQRLDGPYGPRRATYDLRR